MEQEVSVANIDAYIAKLDSSAIEDMGKLDDLIEEIIVKIEKKYLRKPIKTRPIKILLRRRLQKDFGDKVVSWCKGAFSFGWKEGYKEGFDSDYRKKLDDDEFFRKSLEELHKRMDSLRYQKPKLDLDLKSFTDSIAAHLEEYGHLKEGINDADRTGVRSVISRRYVKFINNVNFGKVQRAYQIGWKVGYKEAREDLRTGKSF